MKYSNIISCVLAISAAFCISAAYSEGQCALHLQGDSHVGLSASAHVLNSNVDRSQHTFQLWFTPSRYVPQEQSLLQTGILQDDNGLWAVEIKFKTTVWARTEARPAVTAVSVDVWSQNEGSEWTKTRYSTILGGEMFPWVHISFNAASNVIAVNSEPKRTDKSLPKVSSESPRGDFALGDGLHGMLEDVRIWSGPSDDSNIHATLCSDTTSQLALYIPFNECEGDVVAAYSYNKAVCMFISGGYDWPKSFPVESSMCPAQVFANDVCSGAERIIQPAQQQDSYELNHSFSLDMIYKAAPVAGIVGIVACAVLISIYRHKRNAFKYSGVSQMV